MSRFTFGAVLILGGVLLLYFVGRPFWQEASATHARVSALRDLSAELESLSQERDRLLAVYRQVDPADLEHLHALAPANANAAEIVSSLSSIADRNQVALGQINIGAAAGTELRGGRPTAAAEVTMTVGASVAGFEQFLRDLERSAHITDVSHIKFSSAEQRELSASVSGTMYFRR